MPTRREADKLYSGGDSPLERPVPYNIEAEEAVLGSLLLDRDGIVTCAEWLAPEHFFRETNGWIYGAIHELFEKREPPDLVTVADALSREPRGIPSDPGRSLLDLCGGVGYLSHLLGQVPTAVHIEYYARIVQRTALQRHLIRVGGLIAGLGYEEGQEPSELIAAAEALLAEIQDRSGDAWLDLSLVLEQNYDHARQKQLGLLPPPISTGLPQLDVYLGGGWSKQDLIVLAALTTNGKTAMSLHFAAAAARDGHQVAFISLESNAASMVLRLTANISGVDLTDLRAGNLDAAEWQRVTDASAEISGWPGHIWFLDVASETVEGIRGEVDKLKRDPRRGCDLVIVDYLQLLEPKSDSGNRSTDVAKISRGLKKLAMQVRVPVIALSQLNRAAVGAEEPGLHHLSESGAVERDANTVLFLHRPDKTKWGLVNLLIAKQREGEARVAIPLIWTGKYQRFEEET